jgi:hypothetical protein
MVVAATSHTFAADGTNYADLYYTYTDPTAGVKIARALTNTANFKNAPATGGALTFANEITIGTTDYRITNMYEWDGVLYIFKEDGLFYFDGTKVYRVGNSFSDAPDADNGVAVGTFNKNLWFGWSHSIQRMIGADAEDMLNFKFGYEGLPADRRGTISAIVSGVGWLFVAIDGGASNYSSVLCYSGYGWHEIFRGWATGVRIRNLAWQPCPGTRSKLWIDINGEMVYIEFPKECANPTKDTTLPYQHEGVLTTATIDAGDPTFYKIFHELKVLTEELSTVGTIEVDYQTNESVGTSTWTVLGTIDDSPSESITMDYGSVYQIRFRFRFQTKASVTPTVMTAWETNGWETELLKYQFIPSFRVSTEQDTKTGETDHNPNTMITWLKTVSSTLTKLTMRSLNSSMDNKVVFVSAPAISRDYVDEDAWGGRLSFVIREV